MTTLRTAFNELVNALQRWELYQIDDEVGIEVQNLSDKIDEVYKRIQCIDNTAEDMREAIAKFTERVDKNEPFIMDVNHHDSILRGSNDILIATDFEDDEVIINNWYGLFAPKDEEEIVPRETLKSKFFKIKSHIHKQLEGKTFILLETSFNEVGHWIGALDCPHPEDETTSLWVNLDLDGEFVDEPTDEIVPRETNISVDDVVKVAMELGMNPSIDEINEVILYYNSEAEQDSTATWELIVENLLYNCVAPSNQTIEDKVELSGGGIPYRVCYECSIKEEENVMKQVNGYWLCCDCCGEVKDTTKMSIVEVAPTELCKTPQTHEFVKDIIAKLKVIDVDGETMQYILEQVGMEEQMLKQLIKSCEYLEQVEEIYFEGRS